MITAIQNYDATPFQAKFINDPRGNFERLIQLTGGEDLFLKNNKKLLKKLNKIGKGQELEVLKIDEVRGMGNREELAINILNHANNKQQQFVFPKFSFWNDLLTRLTKNMWTKRLFITDDTTFSKFEKIMRF